MSNVCVFSCAYGRAATLSVHIDKATEQCPRVNNLCLESYCCLSFLSFNKKNCFERKPQKRRNTSWYIFTCLEILTFAAEFIFTAIKSRYFIFLSLVIEADKLREADRVQPTVLKLQVEMTKGLFIALLSSYTYRVYARCFLIFFSLLRKTLMIRFHSYIERYAGFLTVVWT